MEIPFRRFNTHPKRLKLGECLLLHFRFIWSIVATQSFSSCSMHDVCRTVTVPHCMANTQQHLISFVICIQLINLAYFHIAIQFPMYSMIWFVYVFVFVEPRLRIIHSIQIFKYYELQHLCAAWKGLILLHLVMCIYIWIACAICACTAIELNANICICYLQLG